jgi:membrane-associated HD superfamily phosphohydrolase
MLVLKIIGVIFVIAFVIFSLFKIKSFYENKFNKRLYLELTSILISVCYVVFFFSFRWYENALSSNGDIYNGLILMSICLVTIICVIIYNIKQSNFLYGVLLSIYQLIACIVGVAIIIFVILIILGISSNIRPVYKIN